MERVRIAVIGSGGITRWHLGELLKSKEAEIVALCDPNPDQVDSTKVQFPQLAEVPVYSASSAVYEMAKPDAVLIMSPHKFHHDQIVEAFEAKCHVMAEKPLVGNADEAQSVINARDKSGKIGFLSYQRHLDGEFRYVREQVLSGKYGPLKMITMLLCQSWKQFTVGSWRQVPDLSCGGMLNDSGSHMMDMLLWTSGMTPESVTAVIDNCDSPVDINAVVTVRFKEGAIGAVTVVGDAALWHEENSWSLEGATLLSREGKVQIHEAGGRKFTSNALPGMGSPAQHFIDVIKGRAELQSSFEHGKMVAELTAAAYKAAETGSVVKL
ncbi:MAG: Gfo/Idh/MocA family oxidoreductase [Armatimonadetes bacterium]|nr:Gfo/Idh/MocA family oxidoreductase [Armatimonadota bacterium]